MKTRVWIKPDRMGNLLVWPSKKFTKTWLGKTWDDDRALKEGAFLQLSQEQEPVLNAIPKIAQRELARGWDVMVNLPDYEAEAIFNCAY